MHACTCAQIVLNTRALDQVYRGRPAPLLYDKIDLPVSHACTRSHLALTSCPDLPAHRRGVFSCTPLEPLWLLPCTPSAALRGANAVHVKRQRVAPFDAARREVR